MTSCYCSQEDQERSYKIVYFDLESSGFGRCADILQIAAKSDDRIFSVYVNPSKYIAPSASDVTGLENINGELFFHGIKVPSIPLQDALQQFFEFLNYSPIPSLLIAHNARFDTMLLLEGMERTLKINDFKSVIDGFSDSLSLLKKKMPDRKGEGQFKLTTLASDFLQEKSTEQFHEALYDVKILEKLVCKFLSPEELYKNRKSYSEALNEREKRQLTAKIASTLEPLEETISKSMIQKIAGAGLEYSTLKDAYRKDGPSGLKILLSEEQEDGKPRVTNSTKIFDKIVTFLETKYKTCK